MKNALWILIGLVAGFLMGGIGPRQETAELQRELARVEDELVKAQEQAKRSSRRSWVPVPGLDGVFQNDGARDETPEPPDPEPADEPGPDAAPEPPAPDTGAAAPDAVRQDLGAEFDAAVDAQRLRARQSRAALSEQADLDADQNAALDDAIDVMNDELADIALDLEEIPDLETMTPAEFLGLSHDVTGVLYDAQIALEDAVGPGGVEAADESTTQVWNYIDLESFRGVVEGEF